MGEVTAAYSVPTFNGNGGNGNTLSDGHSPDLNGDANWTTSNTLRIDGAGANSGGTPAGASMLRLAAGRTQRAQAGAGSGIAGGGSFNNAGTVVLAQDTLGIAANFDNIGSIDARAAPTVVLPTAFTHPGRPMGTGTFKTGSLTNSGHVSSGE